VTGLGHQLRHLPASAGENRENFKDTRFPDRDLKPACQIPMKKFMLEGRGGAIYRCDAGVRLSNVPHPAV
jgi:hypothetical protein